jgi:hypothetical protein
MLQPDVYKIVHVAGILLVFMSLGGLSLHAINGGTRETNAARRLVGTWVKIGIWLLIGGLLALPGRRPEAGRWVWIVAPLLGVAGAWLAGTKPF